VAEAFTSYVVDNDRRFREALSEASKTVVDFRIPFGLISRDFYRSEQAIFKLKGPGLYPPFKKSEEKFDPRTGRRIPGDGAKSRYQLRKLKKYGFDYPLLVATGRLAASLLGPSNAGSINRITKLSLTIGTSVDYGIYHQSDEARKVIPLRKFIFIGPEAPRFANSDQQGRAERWFGYIRDHVVNTAKRLAK
jgi:hypothetical protein